MNQKKGIHLVVDLHTHLKEGTEWNELEWKVEQLRHQIQQMQRTVQEPEVQPKRQKKN